MFKIKRIIFAAAIAVIGVFCFSLVLRQIYVPPIIMYHSVNPKQNPAINRLIVSPETFERQMRFLRERKYNIILLDELAELIREKKNIPARTIVITFDDGYKDNYTYAFPILKKYKIPATMFIIIDEVSRPQGDRLSWDDILRMQDSGLVVFGSHTIGATPLVKISSEDELKRQIFYSKKMLESKLGRRVDLFSYPEGMFNAKIKQLVIDAGYKAAVATNPGKEYSPYELFLLKRLRISENAANLFVFWFETTGYYTFFKERRHK